MYIEMFYIIVFFLFGLVLGSFFNVVGMRVPKKESIVSPPSHCPNCGTRVKARDLIPVVSYIMLGGKCRHCQAKISALYPLVELAAGVLFAIAPLKFGISKELLIALPFFSLCLIVFVTDIKYMLIPDKILLPFAVYFLVVRLFIVPAIPWWDAFVGALSGFVILFVIAILSKGGMGSGDIKLFFVLGLIVGWKGVLLTLILASFLGAVIGGIGMLLKKISRREPVPFGPFIIVSAIIVYFYGEAMIRAYVNLL